MTPRDASRGVSQFKEECQDIAEAVEQIYVQDQHAQVAARIMQAQIQ